MVNIPLPGLPDINVNLPDVNLPDVNLPDVNLPDIPDISDLIPDIDLPDIDLPDLPDLPTIPGTDIPNIPGIGLWPGVRDVDVEAMFWDLVDKLDGLIVKYGLPSPKIRPILDQFSLIDSERFKQAAQAWGKNLNELGAPAAVGKSVSDKVDDACDAVNERWTGDAAKNFNKWMTDLSGVVEKYGAPAHQVGNVLDDIAEKFKLNWLEIIGLVVGMAGMIVGLAAAPETGGASLVLFIAGAILGAVGMVVSLLASIFTRLDPVNEGIEELREEVNKKIPRAPDARVPLPDRDKWRTRTVDPLT